MSIVTIGKKSAPFSWLPNYLVNDPNVSSDALAVALYLNGKPEGWQARPVDIKKRFGWGRHTWLSVSKELRELGVLHEIKHKDGTSLYFELPDQDPPSDFRTVRKPTVGKSDPLINKDYTNKDLTKNKEDICASDDAQRSEIKVDKNKSKATSQQLMQIFEKLWDYYPVKKGKQRAYLLFLKLTHGKTLDEVENLSKEIWGGLTAMLQEHRWMKEFKQEECGKLFIPNLPHGSTFFAQKRWLDTYETDATKLLEKLRDENKPKRGWK